jgi:HSP20 family protein
MAASKKKSAKKASAKKPSAKKSSAKKPSARKAAAGAKRSKQIAGKAKAGSEVKVEAGTESSVQAAPVARLDDLEKIFDDFFQRHWLRPMRWDMPRWPQMRNLLDERAPSLDVIDRDNEIVVRAEVPGIDKEDLDVSLVDRRLTIKGSSRHEEKKEEDDYVRQEIRSGSFSRSVLLPAEVDSGKAKAVFKDGVVELTLPKIQSSKRQTIAVS